MEKGKAIAHSLGVDKGKEVDLDKEYFEEGDDEMFGMISIIPTEYLGEYEGDPEEDYDMEAEEAFSFIQYEDEPGYFLRPSERQKFHLRPLHITTTLSGIKVNKCLIDGGAAISLPPERMLMKVGKHPDDLVPTNIAVIDFSGCYLSSEGLTMKLRYSQLNTREECGVGAGSSKAEFERSDKRSFSRALTFNSNEGPDVEGPGSTGTEIACWGELEGLWGEGKVFKTLDGGKSKVVVSATRETESESGATWYSVESAAWLFGETSPRIRVYVEKC
ncbi:hypothetical protein Ahy_A06g026626 [Arachis hypogaea]|uniref:Peptidase A2 domain-containing protein n=1 Tax=Arachis hypogaea TaxID=3818 RepID=A0A445CL74_ARAHY|nr:hypothetical protein Ahy_A06g026626 [Arachis hypogaea]